MSRPVSSPLKSDSEGTSNTDFDASMDRCERTEDVEDGSILYIAELPHRIFVNRRERRNNSQLQEKISPSAVRTLRTLKIISSLPAAYTDTEEYVEQNTLPL